MILRWNTIKNTYLIFLNKLSGQKLSPLRGSMVWVYCFLPKFCPYGGSVAQIYCFFQSVAHTGLCGLGILLSAKALPLPTGRQDVAQTYILMCY